MSILFPASSNANVFISFPAHATRVMIHLSSIQSRIEEVTFLWTSLGRFRVRDKINELRLELGSGLDNTKRIEKNPQIGTNLIT